MAVAVVAVAATEAVCTTVFVPRHRMAPGHRDTYQLPLAPLPDELPPPELLLKDELLSDEEDQEEEEKNESSLSSRSRGMTLLDVSVRPQCSQRSVIVSRPLCHFVGERTRSTVVLSVAKPQAGHVE